MHQHITIRTLNDKTSAVSKSSSHNHSHIFRLLRGGEPNFTRLCINIPSLTHQTKFGL